MAAPTVLTNQQKKDQLLSDIYGETLRLEGRRKKHAVFIDGYTSGKLNEKIVALNNYKDAVSSINPDVLYSEKKASTNDLSKLNTLAVTFEAVVKQTSRHTNHGVKAVIKATALRPTTSYAFVVNSLPPCLSETAQFSYCTRFQAKVTLAFNALCAKLTGCSIKKS